MFDGGSILIQLIVKNVQGVLELLLSFQASSWTHWAAIPRCCQQTGSSSSATNNTTMEGSIRRHLLIHTSWTTCGRGKLITQTIQQWKDQYGDIYSFTLPGQHVVVVSLSLKQYNNGRINTETSTHSHFLDNM